MFLTFELLMTSCGIPPKLFKTVDPGKLGLIDSAVLIGITVDPNIYSPGSSNVLPVVEA